MNLDIFGDVRSLPRFAKPPLPFLGNKAHYLPDIFRIVQKTKAKKVLDLFGGSGIISHDIKRRRPDLEVTWNDFDDYAKRLDRIPESLEIRRVFLAFCDRHKVGKRKRLSDALRDDFFLLHLAHRPEIDVRTISLFVNFSGTASATMEELGKRPMWRIHAFSDGNREGYLEGVKRVQADAFDLIKKVKKNSTLMIVDPPYVGSESATVGYYCDIDITTEATDKLIRKLRKLGDFIFFTSGSSPVAKLESLRGLNMHSYSKSTLGKSIRYDDLLFSNIDVTR